MKQVILMRHAKSDWSDGASSDHDRPLNPRGRRAATALGDWLRANDLVPDQLLCSTALRTRETAEGLILPESTEISYLRPLYLAPHEAILHQLQGARGENVMIIGHNPGIGWAAEALVHKPPEHPGFARYPTGATLVATLDIADWADAAWGTAKTRHFVVPREL